MKLLKNTSKLISLFLLLLLSFIYTDKVFSEARNKDPIMQEVISYKNNNDILPIEPTINDNEMILGISGMVVNEKESYKNMKDDDSFDKNKIVYDKKPPKTSILNNYNYYIKKGNDKNNVASIIFKVTSDDNIDEILSLVAKTGVKVNFFIDGAYLEKNVETAFSMVNLNCEIYNLGYDGKYSKSMIGVTNNLIESITLKDSKYCLNEEKIDDYKKLCKSKKMYSILPTLIDPTILDLKENLEKGIIISYNLSNYNYNEFKLMINTITSRGYKIETLSKMLTE